MLKYHFRYANKTLKLLLTAIIIFMALPSFASQTNCPEHFANGQAPDLINEKLAVKTKDICYSGFSLKHSGVTRTALYSAEHLTRDRILKSKGIKRTSKFYPDPNIPESERAELHHYARSGYDRGHVAPSADMFDEKSQQESFSLANMVPQNQSINRGIWSKIETATRKLAKDRGEIFVVTGSIYSGQLKKIGGAVLVPTQVFKAIYDPKNNESAAYIVGNVDGAQLEVVSIAELEKRSGINPFPSINNQIKDKLMKLPIIKERVPR